MSQTQTKLLSSVPAIFSLAEGDKITVVTAAGQTALVSLSTLLGAVKVGGRNYIPNSKRFDLSNSTWGVARLSKLVEPLAVGETYIISFDSKSDNLTGRFYLSETAATGFANQSVYANTPFTANGAWQYIWAWVVDNVNGGIEASMDKVKLERGNIPTDWSPAPEDLNWGGVIPSFSEASKASARISRKGGLPHEYIDNTDKDYPRVLGGTAKRNYRFWRPGIGFGLIGATCEGQQHNSRIEHSVLRGCGRGPRRVHADKEYYRELANKWQWWVYPHDAMGYISEDADVFRIHLRCPGFLPRKSVTGCVATLASLRGRGFVASNARKEVAA